MQDVWLAKCIINNCMDECVIRRMYSRKSAEIISSVWNASNIYILFKKYNGYSKSSPLKH